MYATMAADQRKKPVTTVRVGANSHAQERLKKKNLGLVPYSRSNPISLEWDDKNKSVVAKREQIGLSQRHLVSFDGYVNQHQSVVADVLTLPREVFDPDIVKKVLSYEVWQTVLSADDRDYLRQFLPKGMDLHKVLQELLVAHSNFHFGNTFLKWSASLCSGDLHPDAILHQECNIRARKKTYFAELVNYHNGMIDSLLMWKEKWATSKHPEDMVLQEMWRSRKQSGEISSGVDECKIYKVQQDAAGTSESNSLVAGDNSGSSDNENLVSRDKELQKGKVTIENRSNNLAAGLKALERSKKGDMLYKQNIQNSDGSRYMSYIKVSRNQHQRVKSSMTHSSNSIQSKSLNRVLGDLHSFNVQPFKIFEEEERKKLHSHWLQLATKDVPVAFANLKRWQLAKSQLSDYWKKEMKEKLLFINENGSYKEKNTPYIVSSALVDIGESSHKAADAMEIEEKEQPECLLQEPSDDRAENDKLTIPSGVLTKENIDSITGEVTNNKKVSLEPASEDEFKFTSASTQNQHILGILTEISGGDRTRPIEADSNNYLIRKRDDSRVNASEYLERLKRARENAIGRDSPLCTSSNIWPLINTRNPLLYSTSNSNVGSLHLASLGYPEEQHSHSINLESVNDKEVARNDAWHKQLTCASYLSPYITDLGIRGQNKLPHHQYLNPPDDSLYHSHEQGHSQFDLPASSSVLAGSSQYSGNLGEQLNMSTPLIGSMRDKNLLQQDLSHVPTFQNDWAVNTPAQSLSPFQPRMSLGDNQICGGWSNLESSSYVAGFSDRSNIDESLYDVGLSHFNNNNENNLELPYSAPFDSAQGTPQQVIRSGFGYGGGGVSFVPSPTINNNVLLEPHSDLMNGQVAKSSEWMNISAHQNSDIQDSMDKPFPRPWDS